jgi:nitroreductase
MTSAISSEALAQLFISARSHNEWSNEPLDTSVIRNIYDVMKWGPTSGNCNPAQFVWVHSPEAKAQLAAHATDLNKAKVLAAPLTAIIGYDLASAIVPCRAPISCWPPGRWGLIADRCQGLTMRALTKPFLRARRSDPTFSAPSEWENGTRCFRGIRASFLKKWGESRSSAGRGVVARPSCTKSFPRSAD